MINASIPHTDIMLDDNYDLVIDPVKGDFVVGQSAAQEAKLILKYNQGTLRQAPSTGIGIDTYINGQMDSGTLKNLDKLIQQQFEMDDKTIDSVDFIVNNSQQLLDINIDFEQNQ